MNVLQTLLGSCKCIEHTKLKINIEKQQNSAKILQNDEVFKKYKEICNPSTRIS
jgi:hypothetical protein